MPCRVWNKSTSLRLSYEMCYINKFDSDFDSAAALGPMTQMGFA